MLHGKLMHVFQSVALVIINELLQLKHKDYCYKLYSNSMWTSCIAYIHLNTL